jgi:hypothetical protein
MSVLPLRQLPVANDEAALMEMWCCDDYTRIYPEEVNRAYINGKAKVGSVQ